MFTICWFVWETHIVLRVLKEAREGGGGGEVGGVANEISQPKFWSNPSFQLK